MSIELDIEQRDLAVALADLDRSLVWQFARRGRLLGAIVSLLAWRRMVRSARTGRYRESRIDDWYAARIKRRMQRRV